MTRTFRRIETKLIHAGEPHPRIEGAVSMPVFRSSTFESGGEGSYHDLRYIRLNNTPNHRAVHEKLAALEGGEAAIVTASGMAAISTALLTVLRPGDHLIAQGCLYGGTHSFITHDLAGLGVEVDLVPAADPALIAAKIKPNTKAVYVETMANPLLDVGDLQGTARLAKERDIVSLIDNTFASPYNFRPIEHGFDISLHSCTKYLNGHSDLVAGAAIGSAKMIEAVTHRLNHFGGCLNPDTVSLLHRGMKTLALRMARQNESALTLARALERNPAVAKVYHPGLESHPGHARARALFNGFGGMLSFELTGGVAAAETFCARVKIAIVAPSLGGVETLVVRPALTSHRGLTPEERRAAGIAEGLVRVSVGIEAIEDLVDDFEQALAGVAA